MAEDPAMRRLRQLDAALPDPQISSELAMAIFENSADAMVIVNMETSNVRYINKMAELILGYHRSEVIGESVQILVPDDKKDQHEIDVRNYVREPRTRPMHGGRLLGCKHKDGHIIQANVMLSPVSVPEGRFVVATIRPYTGELTAVRFGDGPLR